MRVCHVPCLCTACAKHVHPSPLTFTKLNMTIRYIVTRGDLLFATFRSLIRNRFILVIWTVLIGWICFNAVRGPQVASHALGYKLVFCIFMAVFYFVILFSVTFALTSVMMLLRRNTGLLGEHRLSISDEGITESTSHNESLNRWSAYHRTVKTKRHLMLYVTEVQYHIISRRRPLLEGDLRSFEAMLDAKTKKANQTPEP